VLSKTSYKTPVGTLYLIADEQILLAAGFTSFSELTKRLSPLDASRKSETVGQIPVISDLIADYFNGETSALNSIKVRQSGPAFSQSVWKAMRKVLVAPIIPCHRIVKSGGALGNYAYGEEVKEWLLRHEGALQ
jgi:methylated-DNA-[protein]-cysteine S-methyltransferase